MSIILPLREKKFQIQINRGDGPRTPACAYTTKEGDDHSYTSTSTYNGKEVEKTQALKNHPSSDRSKNEEPGTGLPEHLRAHYTQSDVWVKLGTGVS